MSITKSEDWFNKNVYDNKEELIEVGNIANAMLFEQLNVDLSNPKTTIAAYVWILNTILDVLKSTQNENDEFCINIADRFRIGYTNISDDEEEKDGNYMIYIQHLNIPHPYESLNDVDDDEEDDTALLCVKWNASNIKAQAEIIKEISVRGRKNLSDLINIKLDKDVFVMPLFCIIHDAIVNYVHSKRVDLDDQDYQLDICGLYTIGESIDAENVPEIYYEPSITLKLMFKDDANAGSND